MKYYILKYHLASDYLARRTSYREEHLNLATELHQKGELILGGALTDPTDEAFLVFYVVDKSVIENFVSNDPYVKNGLVIKWEIREWIVAIGKR